MKLVAPKALGTEKLVAPKAGSSMSKEAFAEAFGAVAVHEIGEDTNPFSLAQLARDLQARLASNSARSRMTGKETR